MTENITINDISHFLINNNYQLTALEFDFELIERGNENKFLRNYFTNPENFENISSHVELPTNRMKASPSISTIDSIDFAKYSDDELQQSDERIKVLEFELRKKNEEVRKLREELTLMSISKSNKSFVVDWIPNSTAYNENYEIDVSVPLMAHENRALNFLINEYLLQHGFKLTAVSFSEEVIDQDIDTWDDVGLNIPKLPNLECFIRAKRPCIEDCNSKKNFKNVSDEIATQTDPIEQELLETFINSNNHLQNDIESLNKELEIMNLKFERTDAQCKDQAQLIITLKKELNDARSKLICAQRDLMYESAKKKVIPGSQSIISGEIDFRSETISMISDGVNETNCSDTFPARESQRGIDDNERIDEKPCVDDAGVMADVFQEIVTLRNPTPSFANSLRLFTEDGLGEDHRLVSLVDSLDQFVALITEILPNLFEATHDKNNADLTILLVQCACLHPDSKTREKLLKFLINLHPEPSAVERALIMKQVQTLSGYLGPFRVEAELITQIWEMLYEKPKPNANKRILLANICGIVCPLAPSNLRSSLILSIHQQMLEEEHDSKVVPHIISSIASTIPYLEDVDKIPLIIHIISKYLWKPESSLSNRRNQGENEVTAEDVVKARLLPAVAQWCLDAGILHTSLIHEILLSMNSLSLTVNNIDYHSICAHLKVLQLLIPFIEVWIKLSTPQILDSFDNDKSSISTPIFDPGRIMELYRIELIISREKYQQIHRSFIHYTGINIPKSMISSPSESSVDAGSIIQCWTPWAELRWLQTDFIQVLVLLLTNIRSKVGTVDLTDPHVMSDLAKNQFTASPLKSKEVCVRIGEILFEVGCRLSTSVLSSVILPCFTRFMYESSDKGVDCNLKSDSVSTGIVSGYCALLAALVHMDSSNTSADNLKKFLTNISFLVSVDNLPNNGVKLAIDVLCSGLGNVNALSEIILASLQPCIACPNVSVRLFVCLMLQELVVQLSNHQRTEDRIYLMILNCLKTLIECTYEVVKVMAVGPLVSLIQAKSISPATLSQVFNCLSDLMNESVSFKSEQFERPNSNQPCTEVLITALIQMINVVGPTSPESFKDEVILPWLLGITEINNCTSDTTRRSGIAMILYSTFSTLGYYLESSSSLETCLLPALDRLRLDMLELYPENVKEVEIMSQDIRKRIEIKQKTMGIVDGSHNTRGKATGLNLMSRTANATSSATSVIFGKFKDLRDAKSEDSSDSTTSTKSNITNFFSKRR